MINEIEKKLLHLFSNKKGKMGLLKLKEELYDNVFHKIRTHLTAIRGFTELLLDCKRINNGASKDLKIILKNENQLENLVNKFQSQLFIKDRISFL